MNPNPISLTEQGPYKKVNLHYKHRCKTKTKNLIKQVYLKCQGSRPLTGPD